MGMLGGMASTRRAKLSCNFSSRPRSAAVISGDHNSHPISSNGRTSARHSENSTPGLGACSRRSPQMWWVT